jgi:hypothetical protein
MSMNGMQPGIQIGASTAPVSVEGKITPEMIQILRSDKLRSYRIDIETDSTVFEDAEAEKQSRTELLKSISEFVTAWFPIIAAKPQLLPLAFEMLSFGVRGFKAGRQLEESIEQAKLQLEEAAKQPPPPSPEQIKAEGEKAKAEMDMRATEQKHVVDMEKLKAEVEKMHEEMAMLREQHAMKLVEMKTGMATKIATSAAKPKAKTNGEGEAEEPEGPSLDEIGALLEKLQPRQRPMRVTRDGQNRITGIEPVQ